jgi:mRNA-degrading endonuclease toxin of MazEF toxin-antitoxin module
MVGSIYYINMPYSNFKESKGRPVLIIKYIDKNDSLILPLTTNLQRTGIQISNKDIEKGSLKKESVVIVPKITAIDQSLISDEKLIAVLKEKSFQKILQQLCRDFEC